MTVPRQSPLAFSSLNMAELAGHVEVVDITTHVVAPGPVAEEAVILKSGTLTKEGSFVKSWKSAWFELTARQMTYYNDSVRRTVPLAQS